MKCAAEGFLCRDHPDGILRATIHTVFEQQNTWQAYLEKIQNGHSWGRMSVQQAHGLSTLLEDENFIFFLLFVHALMYVDVLYNIL